MAALNYEHMLDLAIATEKSLGRGKLVDLSGEMTEYSMLGNLLNKNRVVEDGDGFQWNYILGGAGNARAVPLYNRDTVNNADNLLALSVMPKNVQAGMCFDVREQAVNRGSQTQILNYVKKIQMQRDIDAVKLWEEYGWQGPTSSSDTLIPYGLFGYWFVYNASTGFYGGNNATIGTIGGQSATTYTQLKHYTAQYTNVTPSDLISKVRTAIVETDWKPVVKNAPIPDYVNGQRRVMYASWSHVLKTCEDLAKSQNDNEGHDLGFNDGEVTIQRIPMVHSPWIHKNKATSQPVIGIDWAQIQVVASPGQWERVTPLSKSNFSHNVMSGWVDWVCNTRMYDRRKMFLIAKSDTLSS